MSSTYAQDLNRACLAFLRAEQAEAWSANIANGARTRMGRPVRVRALSPAQELAQRVLRHADPFTLPDDEPEQTDTTPTKAPMHTLTVDPTNTKIKTRKVHSHTDKERARRMHANGARFTDIARELGVSNSTLSYWLSKPTSQSTSQPISQSTSQPASAEPAPVEPASVESVSAEPVSAEPALTQLQEITEQIRALTEKREALLAPLRAEREALLKRLAYLEAVLK